jgi:hypothetical protein
MAKARYLVEAHLLEGHQSAPDGFVGDARADLRSVETMDVAQDDSRAQAGLEL